MAQNMPQNNAQGTHTPNGQSRGGTPAPADGAQPLPVGGMPVNVRAQIPMPPGATIVRREAVGPNGDRWTVTYNNTNFAMGGHPQQQPILPRPFPHPSHIPGLTRPSGAGDAIDQLLPRVRNGLLAARHEMDNVRMLLFAAGGQVLPAMQFIGTTAPHWRVPRIQQHLRNLRQNLDQVQHGLASLLAEPTLANNPDVLTLRAAANELSANADQLCQLFETIQRRTDSNDASATQSDASSSRPSTSSNLAPGATQAQHIEPRPSLADVGPELFLLSSPQGPVGILYDQRGTYTTAPLVSTLPFQSFSQQFTNNRQLLAGLGQQLAHGPPNIHNQLAGPQPVPNAQAAVGAQQPGQEAAQGQVPGQDQNRPPPPVAEQDRLGAAFQHMWLIVKLAVFIYFFAGHGGWSRPIMMGLVAGMVYLANIGMFQAPFERIRNHFEALVGFDNRAQNQNQQGQNGQAQPRGQGQPAQNQNLTPEQAAQRLLQQHRQQRLGWLRERTRTIERAFALFVASLWPGLGERMVQAQEERLRAERQAEEERQQAEEQARQEAEQADQPKETADMKAEGGAEDTQVESSSSGKGKEKVEVAQDGEGSGP